MRYVTDFTDYTLIDASSGEKLEQWGGAVLIRPEPQAVWHTPKTHPLWKTPHAVYHRSAKGGGAWEILRPLPADWRVTYRGMTFRLRAMGFKHTGLFPEQAVNWNTCARIIRAAGRPVKVLNLFAYTGAATVACLKAGAAVTHVDAARGMVNLAKENAALSGVANRPVRWLVDDCMKFLAREIRRGARYDAVMLDPPAYGRGPGGELWRLEDQLEPLLRSVGGVLSDTPLFVLLNTYTSGLSPEILTYLLRSEIGRKRGGKISTGEIGLPVAEKPLVFPCGSSTLWVNV